MVSFMWPMHKVIWVPSSLACQSISNAQIVAQQLGKDRRNPWVNIEVGALFAKGFEESKKLSPEMRSRAVFVTSRI
jgi:hypothetical protein